MRVEEPLDVGGVFISEVDYGSVTDNQIRQLHAFRNELLLESNPEDPPDPIELTEADIRHHPAFIERRGFWAHDGHDLVATGGLHWATVDQNRHVAQARIQVDADHRRRGIGTALLRLLTDAAESQGRTLLMGYTTDRVPTGGSFARRVDAEVGLSQHINRVVLAGVDRSMLDRWIEEGPRRAEGYSLIRVDGDYPDNLVEAIVDVLNVMNTAPREDLDMEDEFWTVEQAREMERLHKASGLERWTVLARHDGSDELVGFTEVGWFPKAPKTVWQWGTAVRPEHRGHAIGKWLKATMMRRIIDERQAVDVRTGNADSNDAMLGINRQLGFGPYQTHVTWQASVETLRAYLGGSRA